HGEHVVIVERRRPHPDHHVPLDRRRHRVITHELELLEPAVLAQNERLHGLVAAHRLRPSPTGLWSDPGLSSLGRTRQQPPAAARPESQTLSPYSHTPVRQPGALVDPPQPIDIRHIATLVDQADTALYFHNVIGYDMPVVSGLIRTRERAMQALGCETYREIEDKLAQAINHPIPPKYVKTSPAREVIVIGDEVD